MCHSLETIHHQFLHDYNADRGSNRLYYKEASFDSIFLPLVKLLNNEWMVTLHFQNSSWLSLDYPHIAFIMLPGQRLTGQLLIHMFAQKLITATKGKFRINIAGNWELPNRFPHTYMFAFRPNRENEHQCRLKKQALTAAVRKTCRIMSEVINLYRKTNKAPCHIDGYMKHR